MKKDNFEIFRVEKEDIKTLEEVAEFYEYTYGQEPWEDELERDYLLDYFRNFIDENIFLAYRKEDRVVAMALLIPVSSYRSKYLRIEDICVDSKFQNQNIGSSFLDAIDEYFDSDIYDVIVLNTIRNFPSHHFYDKNGFTLVESSITMYREKK